MRDLPHTMGRKRQRGQAAVEYVIILPSLLLIILGAIQLALLYQAKSTLNYATFLAARQGSLHNGKSCIDLACAGGGMQLGLAYGLMPLYTRAGGTAGKGNAALGLASALLASQQDNPFRQATILTLNPSSTWASAAMVADPYTGISAVPNDNLMYRSSTPTGSGANTMNIQDGNLLKIQVTYCFKMDVPFANQVIYAVNNLLTTPTLQSDSDALPTSWAPLATNVIPTGPCTDLNLIPDGMPFSGKYLPIVASAVVRMQSPYIGP
jgi:Flp pilus assembly protein TadG